MSEYVIMECGCEYVGEIIYYCPLHASAPKMLVLLKQWRGRPNIDWDDFINRVDKVIAEAEPQE